MNEKYTVPLIGVLVVIVLVGFGMIISQQNNQNARVAQSLDAIALNLQALSSHSTAPDHTNEPIDKLNQRPPTTATTQGQAPSGTLTSDQLRARLAKLDWTELYVSTSPKGEAALMKLNDIRSGQKKLSLAAASTLQANGLQTAQFTIEGSITMGNCSEQLLAPTMPDSEYSPGMRTITLYTSASTFSGTVPQTTYLATDFMSDAAGNRIPVLYGPYNNLKANDLIDAFAALRCKNVSEIK